MIHLNVEPAYKEAKIEKLLTKAAESALKYEGMQANELSLVITGDKKLVELNTRFRGIKEVTDVLSFPSDMDAGSGPRYLGDIVISLPRARAQAKAAGHPTSYELQLLTVHGVLHLLGYDHGKPHQKAKMWAAQDKILRELGIKIKIDGAVTDQSK